MVGETYAKRLAKLGIFTVKDLIYHLPSRYEDYSLVSPISRIQHGELVTVKGKIESLTDTLSKNGKRIQKVTINDGTKNLEIIWFNQPFLVKTLKEGEWYNFSGKVDFFGRSITMISPEYEKQYEETKEKSSIHTGRLVPVYPETYGLSSKWLRSRVAPLLKQITPGLVDFLPDEIIQRNHLLPLPQALNQVHFPQNLKESEQAKRRLAFDELFLIQLATLKRKESWQGKKVGNRFKIEKPQVLAFINQLPFQLTDAQKRCLWEIYEDLGKDRPMNRLLEGDVGSGKTVLAAGAIYLAYLNHFQAALMAPTEILATQHYQTLKRLLEPLGAKIGLTTGSINVKKNRETLDLWIGTHALLYNKIEMTNLGLVIIDEQHRFGVEQRAKLAKENQSPHVLTMTATPIPRTIALTLFGDLDLSVLDQMPPGRQKVKTWVVPHFKRSSAYQWIRERVKGTEEQAFIICPFIEMSETMQTIKAATVEFENLAKKIFPDLKLGLLHGRMKGKEKDLVLEKFRQAEYDILVSTPVVEVGIDIPQATIMMIEGADRFGLAQLHQLRGRVGRGVKESYCLLFTDIMVGKPFERLKAMERLSLGMDLAEIDLKLRGPGEIYGTAQHGFPDLRVASYTDLSLIQETRREAEALIAQLTHYPLLENELKQHLQSSIAPN